MKQEPNNDNAVVLKKEVSINYFNRMIDKDFEMHCERAVSILSHDGYVARYHELVGENQQYRNCCEIAWTRTESELRQYGVKRYNSLSSFQACQSKGVKASNLTALRDSDPIVL